MTDNRPLPDTSGFIQTGDASATHIEHAIGRFNLVNEGRIARVRDGLQPRQQQCFDLLPLLFHVNHHSLPGYSDQSDLPTGIAQYHPSEELLKTAQTVARGRMGKSLALIKPQLSALYLMGSSGSVGQAPGSDLDMWLCYDSHLSDQQIGLLQDKADKISQWAKGFNLEVHFFLMNAHRFQGGEQQSLTGEHCGSSAHVMLLDEFYRTAQVLAGNIPAWWLVPTAYENDYAATLHTLYRVGPITESSCTDFGAISALQAGEFIGAGLWQIYKAIDSPYKSVLKLMLLEIYARQFPNIHSLAHRFKDKVYRLQLSLDDLDPYVMLYQRIESYLLARDEHQRLDLIRRCFYFKVGLKLSKPTRAVNWRRELMDNLVRSWGWQPDKVKHLDNFRAWTIEEVISERRLLISELTHSYRFLTEFAAEHHSSHVMSQQDLLILSRKLHAAFDRRQGKIDFIRIGLDIDLSHERIRLYERASKQEPGTYLWAAYNRAIDDGSSPTPLKYAKGLLETLLWCHLNGLIAAHLQIPVFPAQKNVDEYEIRMTLAAMRQHLANPMPRIEGNSFHHPAILTQVLVFINLGRDPLHALSAKGLQKISARNNSLDFSNLRENLILSLDMVLINSWGEVVVERFIDQDALTKGLKSLLNRISKQARTGLPEINTVCHNQTRPAAIAQRVKALLLDALKALCTAHYPKNSRFVFSVSDQYLLFQANNRVMGYLTTDSLDELQHQLAQEQAEYSPVIFDRQFALEQPLWAELYDLHHQNCISLAFAIDRQEASFYLLDEQGSMLSFKQTFLNLATLLAPLVRFLKVTEHRQRRNIEAPHMPPRQIQCFQIVRTQQRVDLTKTQLSGLINQGRFISIQVNLDLSDQGGYEYQVVCQDKEFHSSILGDRLYNAIASFVLGLRGSGQRYPAYITDLALSEAAIENLPFAQDQTLHYVQLKLKLESRINEAMARL
ncbi:class I adenylate cyclase [Reinekea sp.]|jgi:adenylate cyclase class 1|uniref:class I adenylate cyclase n=1 Tax=Reinekea sp. TaxID=1970455 RepID=UPI002A7EC216|nr:class I adenylate cyclase [Reinekea sp.]